MGEETKPIERDPLDEIIEMCQPNAHGNMLGWQYACGELAKALKNTRAELAALTRSMKRSR